MKNLYQSLEVERTAPHDEIKKAYRRLTRRYHPDKNPGDAAAEDRFKEIAVAYEVLSDAKKRKLYDEFGEMSLTQGFDEGRARAYKRAQSTYAGARGTPFSGDRPGEGFSSDVFHNFGEARETNFDDLLSRLFGGGRVRTNGVQRPQSRRGIDIEGEIDVPLLDALAGITVPLRVESQDGTGRTLDVKVPRGVPDGGKLRLRGQGNPGDPAGDILLTVRIKTHAWLTREGADLHMRVPVTAFEAYRGGPIDVPTPWGTVALKLPPGSQGGQTLRLRGQGVRTAKQSGDLLVHLDVRLPRSGDQALLDALAELQASDDPRAEIRL